MSCSNNCSQPTAERWSIITAASNSFICVPTITACVWWLLSLEFQSTSKCYPLTNDAGPRQRQGISSNLSPNTMTLLQTMSSDNKRVQWNFPSQSDSESWCLPASVRSEERAAMAWLTGQDTGKLQCPYKSHSLVHWENVSQGKRCEHVYVPDILKHASWWDRQI